MVFAVSVECNDKSDHLPVGNFEMSLCHLLWSDMCDEMQEIAFKDDGVYIWSRCTVIKDSFVVKFIVGNSKYTGDDAQRVCEEVGARLAVRMVHTLVEVRYH